MWSAQAEAEGLTLLVADNKAGYFGVHHNNPGTPKPYQARLRCGGKQVHLGSFATAEEAALCIARSPEGKEAAEKAAAAPPLTSEEARQQAQAERLTLLVAETKTGYFGVNRQPGRPKPYQAQVTRGGKNVSLGSFATAEEAALSIARSPEGRKAAERAAAAPPPAPPLTSEEARPQAQAERLTLLRAKSKTGYFGVSCPSGAKSYQAYVKRGGKRAYLGRFATAEEAALCVARSPEGQAAAERAAASAEGQGTPSAMPAGAVLKEEGAVPPMPPDAYVKDEEVAPPPMPPGTFFKEENVPLTPSDAAVKQEHEVVVEERSQGGRVKRQKKQ